MHCLVIHHIAFEDLGTWKPVLEKAGYAIAGYEAGLGLPPEDEIVAASLCVVLGGPMSVNDEAKYPWLRREKELVRLRMASLRPIVGVCLGAQMMARALTMEVRPAPAKEIGWGAVRLTEAGLASPLRHLEDAPVLHWHGEIFDLPPGADLLASTELTPHQAFAYRNWALGFQFHPEADADTLERWLIGHACELEAAGVDPARIREDARTYGPRLRDASARMLEEWLAGLHPERSRQPDA